MAQGVPSTFTTCTFLGYTYDAARIPFTPLLSSDSRFLPLYVFCMVSRLSLLRRVLER